MAGPPLPAFRAVFICAVLGGVGCSTPGASLRAEPNEICPGDEVQLAWKATATGSISADQPSDGVGDVEGGEGQRPAHPKVATTYTLEVRHYCKSNSAQATVQVLTRTASPRQIGQSVADASAGCDATSVWVTALASATFWSPRLTVGAVATSDGRSYHIEHGGKVADVTPGHPSDALTGLAAVSPWKLSTPLLSGERCGQKTPRSLGVDVFGICKTGGNP